MQIDLTMRLTRAMLTEALETKNEALVGHAGTHFDRMDQEFPLDYTQREGIVFDVRGIFDREIGIGDIRLDAVEKEMFVVFYSGFSEIEEYGTRAYYANHPQLSYELIDALLEKGISVIGIDFAGIRRTPEHIPADQRCADRGVFVIENLRNLEKLLSMGRRFTAGIYPVYCEDMTGLPCRVVAQLP